MPLNEISRKAVEEVVGTLTSITGGSGRNKRRLADMFLELVDREDWPEYYEVIPEPRCLNKIKAKLEKSGYKNALDVYSDLSLVFANALYYNEEGSQIWKDAQTLKELLDAEWKKRPVLPTPRATPPPSPIKATQPSKAAIAAAESSTKAQTQAQINAAKGTPVTKPAKPATVVQPIAPSPATHPSGAPSSDMDVDVGGPPSDNEGDGEAEPMMEEYPAHMIRDEVGDDIVRQLERGCPRWEGFGEKGWLEDIDLDRCLEIVLAIKNHKDIISNSRVAATLDSIPEEASMKNLSFNHPLSLKSIEAKARSNQYSSSKEFDLDMMRLFEKARRWYDIASEPYGNVLLLQRLYQALTSSTPLPGPPYTSQTNFASLRAGPGTARPLHSSGFSDNDGMPGVTTFRVSTKDRTFVDEVEYKGWTVRLADWLHLANPDDPSRPIVAQVFKCWVSDEPSKKGRPHVTACWYYRPEQTYHPASRQFWENEVFKTGHFADHPLEDIIEKIACQFTARHIRGRPRPPFWYPGWPLYVCDSRYNDRERVFVRIKNWNSCVPEEVRKSTEFMPIYPFERTVFPRRFPSPFLQRGAVSRGAKLPGGIGDAIERADGERIEGGGTGRKRIRKTGTAAASSSGPSRGLYVGNAAASTPPSQPTYSYTGYNVQQPSATSTRRTEDRSVITAAGGITTLGNNAAIEKLPSETARYFDRDPVTNEVLWFSGPPVDLPRPHAPRHSLKYLHHLAMKRKKTMQGTDDIVNGEDEASTRRRMHAPRTMTETLNEIWVATFGDNP